MAFTEEDKRWVREWAEKWIRDEIALQLNKPFSPGQEKWISDEVAHQLKKGFTDADKKWIADEITAQLNRRGK